MMKEGATERGRRVFRIKRNFGMYRQIRIEIRDVTPERLIVGISTRKPLEGDQLAEIVRNAVLNWLQDLLPVEWFDLVRGAGP